MHNNILNAKKNEEMSRKSTQVSDFGTPGGNSY